MPAAVQVLPASAVAVTPVVPETHAGHWPVNSAAPPPGETIPSIPSVRLTLSVRPC